MRAARVLPSKVVRVLDDAGVPYGVQREARDLVLRIDGRYVTAVSVRSKRPRSEENLLACVRRFLRARN